MMNEPTVNIWRVQYNIGHGWEYYNNNRYAKLGTARTVKSGLKRHHRHWELRIIPILEIELAPCE